MALADDTLRPELEPLQVDQPVEVELDGDATEPAADRLHDRFSERISERISDRGEDRTLPEIKTPKNRQEMIQELQKNYSELVGLIRKVDGHLDEQDVRSRRLLEIAERLPAAMDVLPDLRDQNARLAESMSELVHVTREAQSSGEARHDEQQQALGKVNEHLARSSEFEQRLGDSLESFGSTLGDVNSSTSELGEVLETMRARDEKRDAELAKALDSGQRTMMTVLVMCGVSVALVVVLALVALFG